MKSKILYVVKGEAADLRDGFTYARELSEVVQGGLHLLFHYDPKPLESLEDDMAAAAFAQAGEPEAARGILAEQAERLRADAEAKVRAFEERGDARGLINDFEATTMPLLAAVRRVLRERPGIEMVILGPSVMERSRSLRIKTLKKGIHRPLVIMRKQGAEA